MNPLLHSRPWITEADRQAVAETLGSGMLGQGTRVRQFEDALAHWCKAAGGVAVGSGSAALHLALKELGIGAGDAVVFPTYVCTSVLEAVLSTGAEPLLCDVGADWVVTPAEVARVLRPEVKAIIVPHMYGIFADVAAFRAFGPPIVEDLAQAVGARGRALQGDVGIFSFHPTKCLTTGEGGMAVSANPARVEALRRIRDGKPESPRARLFAPLSEMAAALGMSQLGRYEQMLARRARIARAYREGLAPVCPGALPKSSLDCMHFRFPLRMAGGLERVAARFLAEGIVVRRGVDRLLHRDLGLSDKAFPMSVAHFDQTVSLPIYPALSDEELQHCVAVAARILGTR